MDKTLTDIRAKLNYYRRAERAYIKRLQDSCPHVKVKRVRIQSQLTQSMFDLNNQFFDSMTYKVKVVCCDCGKRVG